ncbi:NfeD family protein [Demequina muriae]|uniref:NfeD family protein n=1 Tax=Demequina muriae TaxID=3051664 RepID=A0ABT8GD49_9MICO|nr:NfeD family protein [Demequina sp. EGI L300058]MDN4479362.1 NfeD family protein [Demequina sp. EGI L300058]
MDSLWWFVGAMVLGIVEVFTLDLTFAMLAGGAIAGGAAALLGLPWWVCVIIACAVAALLLFSLRPYLLKSIRAKGAVIETNAAALAGAAARSLDEITEFAGRVKLAGEVWSARTQDDAPAIPEGAEVVVLEIRGATAIVAPEKGN